MRKCPPCEGDGQRWVMEKNVHCIVCDGEGWVPEPGPDEIKCNGCNGSGLKLKRAMHFYDQPNELCSKCDGLGFRVPSFRKKAEQSIPETTEVFLIEAGKPYTAQITASQILSQLTGTIRVCDPYLGTGTLNHLHPIGNQEIRFLTLNLDGKESKNGVLEQRLKGFSREFPKVEFRQSANGAFHDRYILTSDELILVGHGLKDLGNKESFIVQLKRVAIGSMIEDLTAAFDAKWSKAEPLV